MADSINLDAERSRSTHDQRPRLPARQRRDILRARRDLTALDAGHDLGQLHVAGAGAAAPAPFSTMNPLICRSRYAVPCACPAPSTGAGDCCAPAAFGFGIMAASTSARAVASPSEASAQRFGVDAADVLELVAERLADPDRLAAETDHDPADHGMRVTLIAAHAGRGADAVAHAVHAQFRPAHAPQVRRCRGAVDRREHAEFLDARRHAAVHLADEE